MSDKPKQGQAAWNAERDRIAERNEQARKAARTLRVEQDRLRVEARYAARRRDAAAANQVHPPS